MVHKLGLFVVLTHNNLSKENDRTPEMHFNILFLNLTHKVAKDENIYIYDITYVISLVYSISVVIPTWGTLDVSY